MVSRDEYSVRLDEGVILETSTTCPIITVQDTAKKFLLNPDWAVPSPISLGNLSEKERDTLGLLRLHASMKESRIVLRDHENLAIKPLFTGFKFEQFTGFYFVVNMNCVLKNKTRVFYCDHARGTRVFPAPPFTIDLNICPTFVDQPPSILITSLTELTNMSEGSTVTAEHLTLYKAPFVFHTKGGNAYQKMCVLFPGENHVFEITVFSAKQAVPIGTKKISVRGAIVGTFNGKACLKIAETSEISVEECDTRVSTHGPNLSVVRPRETDCEEGDSF